MPEPVQQEVSGKQKTAAAIAAACLVCAPLTAMFEGFAAKTYNDPVGIPTYCYGETENVSKDPNRIYGKSECMQLLRRRMAADYAPRIAICLPELTAPDRKHEFAALIDTSYNAGWARICRSPMAAHIRAGEWASACEAVRSYMVGSVTARPVKGAMSVRRIQTGPNAGKYFNTFRGLVKRRAVFADLCLREE